MEFDGAPARIENCDLHHGTRYGVIFTRSPGCVARRNTIHSTLSQGAIRIRKTSEGRFISELNYGYDFGTWRSDASGTQVQSGSQNFHMFRFNWFHHSECKAGRFDGQPAGTLGTMIGNVGWQLWQGLQIKGDYQKAYNNTFVECGARLDISVINQIAFGGCMHSVTRNNLADRISGHRTSEDLEGDGRIPGFHDHNWNGLVTKGVVKPLLRDPDNFDFRPRNDPAMVDAGTTLVDDRFVPGSWIDNLRFVKVEMATTSSPEYMGRFTDSNIFTPPHGLKKDAEHYWRVDVAEADGTTVKGQVWSFLPCDGQYERYQRIATPANLAVRRESDQVVVTWDAVADQRLAGYNLYRRWGNPEYVTTAGEKLNVDPMAGTTYTDPRIDQKGQLFYVVQAVDQNGVVSFETEPKGIAVE